MTLVSLTNTVLSFAAVAGQAGILLLIGLLAFRRTRALERIGKSAVLVSFAVALVATLGSLLYSEVIGYEPCKLCWFQRIFMYPEVILLGVVLWKKNGAGIVDASAILSAIGAVIAGYHYLLQADIAPALPCSATGYLVSCSERFVMSFGYITIPLMTFTAFVFITLLLVISKIHEKSGKVANIQR